MTAASGDEQAPLVMTEAGYQVPLWPEDEWAGPFVTKSGKVLTDADIQALADEAEAGYDPGILRQRPSRGKGLSMHGGLHGQVGQGGAGPDEAIPECPVCHAYGGGGHGGFCPNEGHDPSRWTTRPPAGFTAAPSRKDEA